MGMKPRKRYVVTTDTDGGAREGEIVLGGHFDDDGCWVKGQRIATWKTREPSGPGSRAWRLVDLANEALDRREGDEGLPK